MEPVCSSSSRTILKRTYAELPGLSPSFARDLLDLACSIKAVRALGSVSRGGWDSALPLSLLLALSGPWIPRVQLYYKAEDQEQPRVAYFRSVAPLLLDTHTQFRGAEALVCRSITRWHVLYTSQHEKDSEAHHQCLLLCPQIEMSLWCFSGAGCVLFTKWVDFVSFLPPLKWSVLVLCTIICNLPSFCLLRPLRKQLFCTCFIWRWKSTLETCIYFLGGAAYAWYKRLLPKSKAPVTARLPCLMLSVCDPGELGDCDPLEHSPELVSEFRFTPKQSAAMEADIFSRWLELRWEKSIISCIQRQVCSKTSEVAKMGRVHHPEARTRFLCPCTSCHNAPAVSEPLIGGVPAAGDLTCSHWMKTTGAKSWAGREVVPLTEATEPRKDKPPLSHTPHRGWVRDRELLAELTPIICRVRLSIGFLFRSGCHTKWELRWWLSGSETQRDVFL